MIKAINVFSKVLYVLMFCTGLVVTGCKKSPSPEQEGNVNPGEENIEQEEVCTDLSAVSTANCYIVSAAGKYSFNTAKGNSDESVGAVAAAEVLWESFGTDTAPSAGDLVDDVTYEEGKIVFKATDKKGNAVIAAKDADGKILWSWHIWLTDQPEEQTYHVYDPETSAFRDEVAGIMIDRNLGATSATPGDAGTLGLLYQWGRKDPFLGSGAVLESEDGVGTFALSTNSWPKPVESTSATGTIEYATEHPTTFITTNKNNNDWSYSDDASIDYKRWQSSKTIYDPCPAGWRVYDGGENDILTAAGFNDANFDNTNKGISFRISNSDSAWYPAAGFLDKTTFNLLNTCSFGFYWSLTPTDKGANCLIFSNVSYINPIYDSHLTYAYSVRCMKE